MEKLKMNMVYLLYYGADVNSDSTTVESFQSSLERQERLEKLRIRNPNLQFHSVDISVITLTKVNKPVTFVNLSN